MILSAGRIGRALFRIDFGGAVRGLRLACLDPRFGRGKDDVEAASCTGFGVDLEPTVVSFDHAVNDRESEPCALALGLGTEEGIEDALAERRIDSRSVVGHRQPNVAGFRRDSRGFETEVVRGLVACSQAQVS